MSLSIGGIPSPRQLLSNPPVPPFLRNGFPDGMRAMTMQTASQVFPNVNFQGGAPPGAGLASGQGLQLPMPGGQTLTLPGPPVVPGGGPAAQGAAGGMPSMPATGPGAALAATPPGQLLGNAADAVRNLLAPATTPPGPGPQAGGPSAAPSPGAAGLPPGLAQAVALPARVLPAAAAASTPAAMATAAPGTTPVTASTPGMQSPASLQAQATLPAAQTPTTAAPAAPTQATPLAAPLPAGQGLQATRGEAAPLPQAQADRAVPQQAVPPTQASAPVAPSGAGLLAAPLAAAVALQAPAGATLASAVAPAGNPQATAPVAGDLGGPSRAELTATGVYTADGPGLRRRHRLRVGPEAIGAWLLALRQGQLTLVRPHDDTPREVARAMQWVFWTLALVAYGCLAVVLAAFLLGSGDSVAGPALRRWSGELALVGLVAAAGAWWFARALAGPARTRASPD
ncbi:hypothetical protein ACF3M1_15655 [Luteimonas sp. WGS1318]|uniref:hypothetical protein n=1 Tax=Luteimonas sp. WGS1318 TaxID=3366815 RepID=UPI00372D2239